MKICELFVISFSSSGIQFPISCLRFGQCLSGNNCCELKNELRTTSETVEELSEVWK